jgi:hypothetical protein
MSAAPPAMAPVSRRRCGLGFCAVQTSTKVRVRRTVWPRPRGRGRWRRGERAAMMSAIIYLPPLRDGQAQAAATPSLRLYPRLGPSLIMALMAGRGCCARPDPEVPTPPIRPGNGPGRNTGRDPDSKFPMRPGNGPLRKQPGEIPAYRFGRESPGTAQGSGAAGRQGPISAFKP